MRIGQYTIEQTSDGKLKCHYREGEERKYKVVDLLPLLDEVQQDFTSNASGFSLHQISDDELVFKRYDAPLWSFSFSEIDHWLHSHIEDIKWLFNASKEERDNDSLAKIIFAKLPTPTTLEQIITAYESLLHITLHKDAKNRIR